MKNCLQCCYSFLPLNVFYYVSTALTERIYIFCTEEIIRECVRASTHCCISLFLCTRIEESKQRKRGMTAHSVASFSASHPAFSLLHTHHASSPSLHPLSFFFIFFFLSFLFLLFYFFLFLFHAFFFFIFLIYIYL